MSVERITEPRCKVCKSAMRDEIDRLLAVDTPCKSLERMFGIPERSFAAHRRRHLNFNDAEINEIINKAYEATRQNQEIGMTGAAMRAAALDIGIAKGLNGVVTGTVEVRASDLSRMIALRESQDTASLIERVDELEAELADARAELVSSGGA
jgi:hypothetical protein